MITIAGEISPERGRPKNMVKQRREAAVLVYRWLILVLTAALIMPAGGLSKISFALVETFAAAVIYNGLVTAYVMKSNGISSPAVTYLDVLMLSVLSCFSGGIGSEVYIFIFFVLGYCGIRKDTTHTIKVGIISVILYTASCILAAAAAGETAAFTRLLVRDMAFLMGAVCISRINFEVEKYDELRKKEFMIARTDKLTGLANRHYFDQKISEEVDYAVRNGTPLNVLIFDIDNFKGFNDTYGHVSGDKLLMLFSDIIVQCIRKTDIPVRYGGEEFLILIREMDIIVAKNVGERIRKQLEKQRIYLGAQDDKRRVTVSCGIAQYPTHSRNIKEVIEMADKALYHAKENGKNIVVTYDEIN